MTPDFAVGMSAEARRAFAAAELTAYADLTGDTRGGDGVPEPLIGALFSYLLGVRLPGPGTNYLRQRLTFHTAARPGEELTARVEVTRVRPDKALVNLTTTCHGTDGRLIADGEALVLVVDTGAAPGESA
jgi:hypothetical protein